MESLLIVKFNSVLLLNYTVNCFASLIPKTLNVFQKFSTQTNCSHNSQGPVKKFVPPEMHPNTIWDIYSFHFKNLMSQKYSIERYHMLIYQHFQVTFPFITLHMLLQPIGAQHMAQWISLFLAIIFSSLFPIQMELISQ